MARRTRSSVTKEETIEEVSSRLEERTRRSTSSTRGKKEETTPTERRQSLRKRTSSSNNVSKKKEDVVTKGKENAGPNELNKRPRRDKTEVRKTYKEDEKMKPRNFTTPSKAKKKKKLAGFDANAMKELERLRREFDNVDNFHLKIRYHGGHVH